MVRMDSASSVPPHIQPPIAHVPSAMREAFTGAVAISRVSMSAFEALLSRVIFQFFVLSSGDHLVRQVGCKTKSLGHRSDVGVTPSYVDLWPPYLGLGQDRATGAP